MKIPLLGRMLLIWVGFAAAVSPAYPQQGSIDPSFKAGLSESWVTGLALQKDGGLVAVGIFLHPESGVSVARLRSDGSLDATFNPPLLPFTEDFGLGGILWSVAVQQDRKILIGGRVRLNIGGDPLMAPTFSIARLNVDGSLDNGFTPEAPFADAFAIVEQPDQRILVGGGAFEAGSRLPNHIVRLNRNGRLDATFDPGTGEDGDVHSVAVQHDKKILIGGAFATVQGRSRSGLARLHADGTVDDSFAPHLAGTLGALPGGFVRATGVYAMVLEPDGKLLIGGTFTEVNGVARRGIARLQRDGSLDPTFDPGTGVDAPVAALARPQNGELLAGGEFNAVDGLARAHLVRMRANGSVDPTFVPGVPAGYIRSIVVDGNDSAVVGGLFFLGTAQTGILRIELGK